MTKFHTLCSCVRCRKETTTGQLTRSHLGKVCPVPSQKVRFPNNVGRPAWNRGLSAETDARVKQNGLAGIGKHFTPHSNEAKLKIRQAALKRGLGGYVSNAGRSKKFKVYDSFGNQTTLQSTYEYACFEVLCELGISWIRPKALKYDGKNYFADFYLVDFDIWLDPKNDYKAKCDTEKIRKVIAQNNVKLFVLTKEQITKEYIGLVTQW